MRKGFAWFFCAALVLVSTSACGSAAARDTAITVISREDGSGTRSAFVELFGVQGPDKRDQTTLAAEITNNTAVMMLSITGDPNAVGYLSLGSLNDTVKPLAIDGTAPSVATVADGTYLAARPFLIATKGDARPPAQDLIDYILSKDGQALIAANGYVRIAEGEPFLSAKPTGKVVLAGSSSVAPILEKLTEAYAELNPAVDIEIQQSDSSTGMNAALDGIADIGLASRALKASETEKGLTATEIAIDGIVVVVNLKNPVDGLTRDQVRAIFNGEIEAWGGVAP